MSEISPDVLAERQSEQGRQLNRLEKIVSDSQLQIQALEKKYNQATGGMFVLMSIGAILAWASGLVDKAIKIWHRS